MKRLLAILLSLGLVLGAVIIRDRVDNPDSTDAGGSGDITLLCGTDLASACDLLAEQNASVKVVVEDEGTTADQLSESGTDQPGFDAWLTAGPWPEIVADNRTRSGADEKILGEHSPVLGRSPATIVAAQDRAAALAASCGGTATWACIGDVAGLPWTEAGGEPAWGTVKPGLPSPESGSGLVTLAQAVASRLGTTSYASNDFEDPALATWFDQLVGQAKRNLRPGQSPLQRFLVLPAAYGAVGALEAGSGPTVARAANGGDMQVIYPEPVSTADVTMTPAAGTNVDDLLDRIGRDELLDALATTGWRVPDHDAARGVGGGPTVGAGSGLPAPGVLQFLRERWEQVP